MFAAGPVATAVTLAVAEPVTLAITALRGGAAGAAWTPAELTSLALWLDADDAGTITLNGSNVSQWSDKSGNARHAVQATAAYQPLYSAAGFNGKPTVRFNQNFLLETAAQFPLIARSVFLVVKETTEKSNSGVLSVRPASGPFNDWNRLDAVAYETGTISEQFAVYSGNYTITPGPGGLASGIYGEVKAAGTGTLFINGASAGNDTAFTEPAALSGGGYVLGARWISGAVSFTSLGLDGDIAEVVYVGATVSTDDRQKLEGYLAHKWALTANLPADHPYKTAPPTA